MRRRLVVLALVAACGSDVETVHVDPAAAAGIVANAHVIVERMAAQDGAGVLDATTTFEARVLGINGYTTPITVTAVNSTSCSSTASCGFDTTTSAPYTGNVTLQSSMSTLVVKTHKKYGFAGTTMNATLTVVGPMNGEITWDDPAVDHHIKILVHDAIVNDGLCVTSGSLTADNYYSGSADPIENTVGMLEFGPKTCPQ